jgi:5-methylcytosine-specific restriction enzyme subunit McrC
LAYTRNTERYRRAIQLARLIILNYSPDVRSGIEDVLAILFDMNTLFERYVYAQLKRAEGRRPESDIIFKAQTSRLFWKAEGMHKYIRPDIIAHIEKGPDRYRIVLDTKWKVPRDGKPSDSDLHQMHSYNLQFGAARSILVYPQISEKKNIQGAFSEARFVQSDKALSCGLMFVDLFESRGLRKDVGEQILSQIMTIL